MLILFVQFDEFQDHRWIPCDRTFGNFSLDDLTTKSSHDCCSLICNSKFKRNNRLCVGFFHRMNRMADIEAILTCIQIQFAKNVGRRIASAKCVHFVRGKATVNVVWHMWIRSMLPAHWRHQTHSSIHTICQMIELRANVTHSHWHFVIWSMRCKSSATKQRKFFSFFSNERSEINRKWLQLRVQHSIQLAVVAVVAKKIWAHCPSNIRAVIYQATQNSNTG